MKLAYEDLSEKQKKIEEKMRNYDPNKAQQLERLGMGFDSISSARSGISHSAVSDMKIIEQANPTSSNSVMSSFSRNSDYKDMERDLMMLELGFSSGPPKYKDGPFNKLSHIKDDFSSDDLWDDLDKVEKKQSVIETIPTIDLSGAR